MDYTYFYKHQFHSLTEAGLRDTTYDLFISSFVDSERVTLLAGTLQYNDSLWLVDQRDENSLFVQDKHKLVVESNEDYLNIHNKLKDIYLAGKSICIDATGFRIPYLLFVIRVLHQCGVKKFDIYYTEPKKYKFAEETEFSDLFYEVKGIMGMVGRNTSETENDLMIIAAGYDHSRIIDVANSKKSAQKVLLLGLPALSPSMFQENIIRAFQADTAVRDAFKNLDSNIFAPAYDPFVAAQSIQDYIEHKRTILRREKGDDTIDFTNIYLAPLSTKPHAIGMALYYMWEHGWDKNITLLYPLCKTYNADNSDGISRIWRYRIQMPD